MPTPVKAARPRRPAKPATVRFTSDERRASIVAAARDSFAEHGYAGARTKEIAERAGINEALIYRHFPSKEALFEAAVIEPLEHWMATYHHLGDEISRTTSEEARYGMLTQTATRFLEEMHAMLPLLGTALFGPRRSGAAFYVKRVLPLLARWTELTRRSLPPGFHEDEITPEFMSKAGTGVAFFLAMDAHMRDTPFDAAALGREMARLWLPIYRKT